MTEHNPGIELPLSEAARQMGLSVDALRKRIDRGKVEAYRRGRFWYVRLPEEVLSSLPTGQSDNLSSQASRQADTVSSQRPDDRLAEMQKEILFLRDQMTSLHKRLDDDATERAELRRLLGNAQMQMTRLLPMPRSLDQDTALEGSEEEDTATVRVVHDIEVLAEENRFLRGRAALVPDLERELATLRSTLNTDAQNAPQVRQVTREDESPQRAPQTPERGVRTAREGFWTKLRLAFGGNM